MNPVMAADVASAFLQAAKCSHIHDISSSFQFLEIGICAIPISQMRKLSLTQDDGQLPELTGLPRGEAEPGICPQPRVHTPWLPESPGVSKSRSDITGMKKKRKACFNLAADTRMSLKERTVLAEKNILISAWRKRGLLNVCMAGAFSPRKKRGCSTC